MWTVSGRTGMPCKFMTLFVVPLSTDMFCSFGLSAKDSLFTLLLGAWMAAAFLLARLSFLGGIIVRIKLDPSVFEKVEKKGGLKLHDIGVAPDTISRSRPILDQRAQFWCQYNVLVILHRMVLKKLRKVVIWNSKSAKSLSCYQADCRDTFVELSNQLASRLHLCCG